MFDKPLNTSKFKAKSLTGLGNIERQAANFEQANIHHQQAVELLAKIAAKCDLAEAYFQWGITLQHNNQLV